MSDELKSEDIENLIEIFNKSDWGEMHLKTDDLEIFLSNDPQAHGPRKIPQSNEYDAAPASAPMANEQVESTSPLKEPPLESEGVPDGMVAIRAPNLGTFYKAPKPGSAPYILAGQDVSTETEVCLIEVMKLFTPVRAGMAGVVREICVQDGEMVEFNQVLMIVEPR